ncbi:nucleotidyl transferase AbiEii/AbiGii toxin family protein, partial [Singulisphaera rosea]
SKTGLPRSFQAGMPVDGALRPSRFDPALLHYPSAFRPGDPEFQDEETGRRWAAHRRRITDHVLRRIAESELGDHLILRGSRLLKAWLGNLSREPGDLDWVSVVDRANHDSQFLIDRLVEAVFAGPAPEEITLDRAGVATDEIWTYERTPGRRAVFPWRVEGLPGGVVQVDVTFGETLSDPDSRVAMPITDGGCVSVRAATKAQSLAWKLLWLWSDMHGQGKDLYDAVLLAERCSPSRVILDGTFQAAGGEHRFIRELTASSFVSRLDVEWEHFAEEYPWVEGDEAHWKNRLELAISPLFAPTPTAHLAPDDPNRIASAWLRSNVVDVARGILADRAWEDLPMLYDALLEAGCDRPDILEHCLKPGPHTRGCWVIDQILHDITSGRSHSVVVVDESQDTRGPGASSRSPRQEDFDTPR